MSARKAVKGCRAAALKEVANQSHNPLQCLDSSLHSISTSDDQLVITCHRWSQLEAECQQWIIDLTETNMKSLYESSECGWNGSQKEKELRHPTARYLLVRSARDQRLVAFSHFRFETGGTDAEFAVYCYELQVESQSQRSGVGLHLMRILHQIGDHFKAHKVMLTVFKCNTIAMNFYTKALHYRIDRSSPSRCQMSHKDYEILCFNCKPNKSIAN